MVDFPLWGNELLQAIKSPDKMKMKKNGTCFTHVTLVYLDMLSLQNLSSLYRCVYVSVLEKLPSNYGGLLSRLLWVTYIAHFLSTVFHALHCSPVQWSPFTLTLWMTWLRCWLPSHHLYRLISCMAFPGSQLRHVYVYRLCYACSCYTICYIKLGLCYGSCI